jgi:hypothetical protein
MILRRSLIIMLALTTMEGRSQSAFQRVFPQAVVSGQYGGSIGLVAGGYHRRTAREHFGGGLLYGYLPRAFGGPLHTVTLAFSLEPWQVPLGAHLRWTPLRAGAFIVLALGPGWHVVRPPYYEPGYYWWSTNFRQHLQVGTALRTRLHAGPFSHAAIWFQANTNDLYLSSWWPNRATIALGEIIHFGAGVDLYFERKQPGRPASPPAAAPAADP